MEVTYQLTADDFHHGMIAWRMRSRWRRWSYRFGLPVMTPILVFSATMLIVYPHPELRQEMWIVLGASVFWLTFTGTVPWLSAHMQIRRMPSAQDPMALAVSESGLRVQSRHGDSQTAWSAFIGWREEKSIFVVFPQPRTYIPIPQRAFTDQQQAEFRETLRRNILPFKNR
jgi:YcxB-like protein